MTKFGTSSTTITMAVWLLGGVLLASHVAAQTAQDLVGTWTATSITSDLGGNTVETYGANPKSILMFDANGRYALVIVRADLPAFASYNRTTGSPEENQAVVQGTIAHFGTYAVEADAIIFRIEAATLPNWSGAEQRRPFTLQRNELRYAVPASSGGGTGSLVWVRAK